MKSGSMSSCACSPIPTYPPEGSLDHPAMSQHGEGGHLRRLDIYRVAAPFARSLDDLQFPFAFLLYPLFQGLAAIAHICPDQLQPITNCFCSSQHETGSVTIHQVGFMNHGSNHKARCINQ